MTTPKRTPVADAFDLLGAVVQAVIVGGGALLIVIVLVHGVAGWILDLLGLS